MNYAPRWFCMAVSGLLVACGGSGGSSSGQGGSASSQSSTTNGSSSSVPITDPSRVKQGYLLDGAVSNIGYRTVSLSGVTDANGTYEYQEGETLEFYIGEMVLPAVRAQATITPLDLAGTTDINNPIAVNIARILQTLDQDGDPDNGIAISNTAADVATAIDFDQTTEAFSADSAVINLVANAGVERAELIGEEEAKTHLQTTLNQAVNDRVVLSANGDGNTYELINQTLGGTAVESPVCDYATDEFGRRITDPFDEELGTHVFAFHILRDIDGDRCRPGTTDRQRMEIKTYNQSPGRYLALNGEIHTYRWKFKLDSGFQPSSNFTHIFQIKPQGGSDESLPILTFTPRLGSPERFEVSFNPSDNVGKSPTRVAEENLSAFKGEWIDAYVRVLNADEGRAEVILTRLRDGEVLIEWSDNNIDMWRAEANFNRPKWGIYRSLINPSVLRDETVLFNDFCIAKGTNTCPADTGE